MCIALAMAMPMVEIAEESMGCMRESDCAACWYAVSRERRWKRSSTGFISGSVGLKVEEW